MKRITLLCSALLAISSLSADVTGAWKCAARPPGHAPREFRLDLVQKGGDLTGTVTHGGHAVPISAGSLQGEAFKFSVQRDRGAFQLEGTATAGQLAGTVVTPEREKAPLDCTRDSGGTAAAVGPVGSWKVQAKAGERTIEHIMDITEENGALRGRLTTNSGETLPLSNLTFAGGALKFAISTDDGAYNVEGKVEGDSISGTYTSPSGRRDTWAARRQDAGGDFSGTWKVTARDGDRNIGGTLRLKQDGSSISGTVTTAEGQTFNISDATLEAGLVKFKVPMNNGAFQLDARLEGGKLVGSFVTPSGRKGQWEGGKQ